MVSVISEWVRCLVCGNKTRLQIRADTELKSQTHRRRADRLVRNHSLSAIFLKIKC